jgi:flagellar biosynthesis protein FlhF
MKIRSYKGRNLETLHETIRRELGAHAVVVNSETSGTRDGWFGARKFELIAVVDDDTERQHALRDVASSQELQRLTVRQEEKWAEMEQALQVIRREMQKMPAGGTAGVRGKAVPDFARDWDARFVALIRDQAPEVFKKPDSADARSGLAGLLRVREGFVPARKNGRPHVVVLTGPTGSGKTTTLAKLAANWRLNRNLKVGLITLDTYRVAAVDQTREYATLLGLELKVVFSAGEVKRALDAFSGMDVVLVDTPGRNHFDPAAMSGLRGIIGQMGEVTTLLLIPATMNPSDVGELARAFRPMEPDYLVITKVDETRRYPVLATVSCECECPVVFLTNGQRVPNDILVAERRQMAEMMMKTPAVETPAGQVA